MLEHKFLVAGADSHLQVSTAREEVFVPFSFRRGVRDVQLTESRAAAPPSAPVPTVVSPPDLRQRWAPPVLAASLRPRRGAGAAWCPPEEGTGRSHLRAVSTLLAGCREPAAEPFGRAPTHRRHQAPRVWKYPASFTISGHKIHAVRYILIKKQSKKF